MIVMTDIKQEAGESATSTSSQSSPMSSFVILTPPESPEMVSASQAGKTRAGRVYGFSELHMMRGRAKNISLEQLNISREAPAEVLREHQHSFPASIDGAFERVFLPSSAGLASGEEIRSQGGVRVERDSKINTPTATVHELYEAREHIPENKLKDFALFLQTHSSPRHQRVTAGGRIVPAEPNSPPPTFYPAFLSDFVRRQANENSGGQSMMSNASAALLKTHPDLKLPAGFELIRVEADGRAAIARHGSTLMFAELDDDGKTKWGLTKHEIKPSTTFAGYGPSKTDDVLSVNGQNYFTCHPGFDAQGNHPNYHGNGSPHHVHTAPAIQVGQFGGPGSIQQAMPIFNQPSDTFNQSRGALSYQQCNDASFNDHRAVATAGRDYIQLVNSSYQVEPMGNLHLRVTQASYQSDLSFVMNRHEEKKEELGNLIRSMFLHGFPSTEYQTQHYLGQKQRLEAEIEYLRVQRQHLESMRQAQAHPASPFDQTSPYKCQLDTTLYQANQFLTGTYNGSGNEHHLLQQAKPAPTSFGENTSQSVQNGRAFTYRTLSPTAQCFVPNGGENFYNSSNHGATSSQEHNLGSSQSTKDSENLGDNEMQHEGLRPACATEKDTTIPATSEASETHNPVQSSKAKEGNVEAVVLDPVQSEIKTHGSTKKSDAYYWANPNAIIDEDDSLDEDQRRWIAETMNMPPEEDFDHPDNPLMVEARKRPPSPWRHPAALAEARRIWNEWLAMSDEEKQAQIDAENAEKEAALKNRKEEKYKAAAEKGIQKFNEFMKLKNAEGEASQDPLKEKDNSAKPWTWAKLPHESDKEYQERVAQQHKLSSQSHSARPRSGHDDENAPFQASGTISKEHHSSATSAPNASMRRGRQQSSVGMRGGNSNYAVVNDAAVTQQASISQHHSTGFDTRTTLHNQGQNQWALQPVNAADLPRVYPATFPRHRRTQILDGNTGTSTSSFPFIT